MITYTNILKALNKNKDGHKVLKRLGLRKIGHGCFSDVYSSKKLPFVVKLSCESFGGAPNYPDHIVPYSRVERLLDRTYVGFQKKVSIPSYDKRRDILDELRLKVSGWFDDHSGNVGVYKGRAVIIDW